MAALYGMRAVKELGIPLSKNVRLILGTDEECGSSDLVHYYGIEEEAPMSFSPDATFPVTNVEKGGLAGHFTGSFEPSDKLPRLVSLEAGIKVNVVPGKAYGIVEGLERSVMDEVAKQVEEETGVRFDLETTESATKITAMGTGAHAAHPDDGNNALTGLLTYLTRLPLAPCGQVTVLHKLLELIPHVYVHGAGLGIAM